MNTVLKRERGAVSLFIVIFAALLIITIVTAFVRIMLQDQQQATANDLAKSALDSAHAGVEDSKRILVEYYKKNCPQQLSDTRCTQLRGVLLDSVDTEGWTTDCDITRRAGVADVSGPDGSEVKVSTSAVDSALDQAYTCVKIQMNPENYIGSDISQVVKLKTKDNVPFDKIKIQWYEQKVDGEELDLDDGTSDVYELKDRWPEGRPQVMRLQLLQYGENFALTDFDNNYENNSTLFLLPTSISNLTTGTFASDIRKSSTSQSTQKVGCIEEPAMGEYACEMTLTVPDVGAVRNAFLKIDQLYASGNKQFVLTLLSTQADGVTEVPVRFADVQIVVDSTGRANDMFKRIRSRVNMGGGLPAPDAAVDLTRSFCKEFLVTNTRAISGSNPDECPKVPGA